MRTVLLYLLRTRDLLIMNIVYSVFAKASSGFRLEGEHSAKNTQQNLLKHFENNIKFAQEFKKFPKILSKI